MASSHPGKSTGNIAQAAPHPRVLHHHHFQHIALETKTRKRREFPITYSELRGSETSISSKA